jgi:hypothetical protein
MSLVPCPTCRRHLRPDAATCPFCSGKTTIIGTLKKAVVAGVATLATASLQACYGMAEPDNRALEKTGDKTTSRELDEKSASKSASTGSGDATKSGSEGTKSGD